MAGRSEMKATNTTLETRVKNILLGINETHLKDVATTASDIANAQTQFITQFSKSDITYDGSTLIVKLPAIIYTEIAAKMLFGENYKKAKLEGRQLEIKGDASSLLASINHANPPSSTTSVSHALKIKPGEKSKNEKKNIKEDKKEEPTKKISTNPYFVSLRRLHDRIYFSGSDLELNLGTLSPEFETLDKLEKTNLFKTKILAVAKTVDRIFKEYRITDYIRNPNREMSASADSQKLEGCFDDLYNYLRKAPSFETALKPLAPKASIKPIALTPYALLLMNHLHDILLGKISDEDLAEWKKLLGKLTDFTTEMKNYTVDDTVKSEEERTSKEISEQFERLLSAAGLFPPGIGILLPDEKNIKTTIKHLSEIYQQLTAMVDKFRAQPGTGFSKNAKEMLNTFHTKFPAAPSTSREHKKSSSGR